MATILLAIGSSSLRDACQAQLEAAGHAPVLLDRPLASLDLSQRVVWDVACLDDTDLGRAALRVLTQATVAPVIGLGLEDGALSMSIALPLVARDLLGAIDKATAPEGKVWQVGTLKLDPARRLASVEGREITLTRTEFRLLEVLFERQPSDVSLAEVLMAVWGFTEGRSTSELVRTHIRNLRAKLVQIGLVDAVRSRRGRGYALVV
jgi:DNA-binding response OmpR family regulator